MHIDEFVAKSQGTQIGGSVVDDKFTISNTVGHYKFNSDVFFCFQGVMKLPPKWDLWDSGSFGLTNKSSCPLVIVSRIM